LLVLPGIHHFEQWLDLVLALRLRSWQVVLGMALLQLPGRPLHALQRAQVQRMLLLPWRPLLELRMELLRQLPRRQVPVLLRPQQLLLVPVWQVQPVLWPAWLLDLPVRPVVVLWLFVVRLRSRSLVLPVLRRPLLRLPARSLPQQHWPPLPLVHWLLARTLPEQLVRNHVQDLPRRPLLPVLLRPDLLLVPVRQVAGVLWPWLLLLMLERSFDVRQDWCNQLQPVRLLVRHLVLLLRLPLRSLLLQLPARSLPGLQASSLHFVQDLRRRYLPAVLRPHLVLLLPRW
jgi:hypothetical protein